VNPADKDDLPPCQKGRGMIFKLENHTGPAMQRLTITVDDDLVAQLDRMIAARGYQNRSEAMRDLARAGMRQTVEETGDTGNCVAALVYVYDHNSRELSRRLTSLFHDHHDLSHSSMHVHLDHGSCMEIAVLHGDETHVRHLADHVIAERGVRHGRLVCVPVTEQSEKHAHPGEGSHRHVHLHVRGAG
jgi:CopG family nickel-responsive transcriptional regulator